MLVSLISQAYNSSSSSTSLVSSSGTLVTIYLRSILRIKNNQNKLSACKLASSTKVTTWLLQHLYCSVSQFNLKGPTVANSVRTAHRIRRLR